MKYRFKLAPKKINPILLEFVVSHIHYIKLFHKLMNIIAESKAELSLMQIMMCVTVADLIVKRYFIIYLKVIKMKWKLQIGWGALKNFKYLLIYIMVWLLCGIIYFVIANCTY